LVESEYVEEKTVEGRGGEEERGRIPRAMPP